MAQKSSKTRKVLTRLLLLCGVLTFSCLALILFSHYRVMNKAEPHIIASSENIESPSPLLVLGCSPKLRSGNDNPFFVYRINAAAEIYKSGHVNAILVSGDNSREEYDESTAMKQALIDKGIPEEIIHLDYAGFSTLDSVVRAKEIFGLKQYIIISQKFHIERAIYIARKHQIDARGYAAEDVDKSISPRTHLREYLARVKALIDVEFIKKSPKFLGEKHLIFPTS